MPYLPPQFETMRASDADRQRAVDLLNEGLVSGRLTLIEHDERMEKLYRAKTLGELAPLTADLPEQESRVGALRTSPSPASGTAEINVVFSKIHRSTSGAVAQLSANVVCGALLWNLSQVTPAHGEIRVDVSAVCAKVILTVPENAVLIDESKVVLGKGIVASTAPSKPAGPVVRLVGAVVMSKLVVRRS